MNGRFFLSSSRSAAVVIVAAVFAAYANTFSAPFVFDGLPLEKSLRLLSWQPATWFRPVPRAGGYFTFDLQYTLHGQSLFWFHAVNIAIHATAAVVLYQIVRQTVAAGTVPDSLRADAEPLALVAALVFALHPLQTQSVTYLYQRFESLMGLWCLAALWCFMQLLAAEEASWRGRLGWGLLAWGCIVLGVATKESAAVMPLALAWYDRVFAASSCRRLLEQRWLFYLPVPLLAAAVAGFFWANRASYIAGGIFAAERVTPLAYLATQPGVILHYLRLFLVPTGQCLDLAWPVARGFGQIVAPTLAIIGLLAATAWATVRQPAIGFCGGMVFLFLAPTSSVAPIIDMAFEHRMYLPLAALATLAAVALRTGLRLLAGRFPIRFLAPDLTVRWWLLIGLGWAALLGVATYRRNEVWRSGQSVWEDVIAKRPFNPRAYGNLAGHHERDTGDLPLAIRCHLEAVRLDPTLAKSHRGLAILLAETDPAAAVAHARAAVQHEPDEAANHNNLGILLAATAPVEAEACFRRALEINPRFDEAALNLRRLEAMAAPQPLPR